MGILTRKQGDEYVISSDRNSADAPTKHAPKRQSEIYEVWTGKLWSVVMTDAKTFESLDIADDYVRANYALLTRHQ
jgi:hypothetical protein